MNNIGNWLVGFKTILGVIIQIAGAIGLIAAGLSDYVEGVEGSGLIKNAIGLSFAGNAVGQLGIRYAKKNKPEPFE